jgi:hypothetical protein
MSSGNKVLLYILSFIVPIVGIILGIVWLNEKDDMNKKATGKGCLISGLVSFGVGCICYLIYIVFIVGMAAVSGGSSY